jgi:DNA-binding transcriptional MocR family regulator
MVRKNYKHHKRGGERFVRLPEWLQNSEAWASMKPGPRTLYVEIKRRFNGSNNGRITLSHREAAKAVNVSKNTVGPYFAVLVDRGFIHMTRGSCLGPSGIGETSHWALDEEPTPDGKPARKGFSRWRPP